MDTTTNNLDELLKEAPTPVLTLEPTVATNEEVVLVEKKEDVAAPQLVQLTPEEQKMVDDFATQIDLKNTHQVIQYGAGSQKKIAEFSETALTNVRTKDMGEVGELLTGVISELKAFEDEEETKGFFGLFKKSANKLEVMKAKYDKADANIDRIVGAMEKHQITLLKDIAVLDKMYDLNLNYFRELTMYILAGKKKLEEAKNTELPELVKKAEQSGLPEDTQAAKDFAAQIDRFEKKIYDLELTRTVALQMAPQIRLIQNNNMAMSEKIQSTLVNTIPLWKSQMVIAIGLKNSTDAAKAQREVTDMTNTLLKKNAEALKMATIETAKEAERGIIDIETLTNTNQMLISTFDEVMKIQEDGRTKRAAAEVELQRIETEMRDKLLTMSRNSVAPAEDPNIVD
ncbi:MAG: toxic anion resistance protein [Lachnospiraceae bacterium]|nr:toxic anion resistance protein [Lachnospiraceae bacterium]